MHTFQAMLMLAGIGIVTFMLPSVAAYIVLPNVQLGKNTNETFSIGCMLIAQYFLF